MSQSLLRKSIVSICSLVLAGAASAATLTIEITEISEPKGKMMVKLVASGAAYAGEQKPTAVQAVDVTSKAPISLKFADLAPGTYAVMVMQDENGNGQLDSNMVGIPKEGYGFSNNPRVMRKPTFDESKFVVTEADQQIKIEIR